MKHTIELIKSTIENGKAHPSSKNEMFMQYLSELESELQQLEGRWWISCSDDHMPDHNGQVLVVDARTNTPEVTIGVQSGEDGFYLIDCDCYTDQVTHWMPLPIAPELTPNK